MKINATTEELARQLSEAAPYLTKYKGSKKAITMFMNILGFTCQCSLTSDNDLSILITNVESLEDQVKNTLADQLHELLPITYRLMPKNIKGYGE